jgi:TetR/AcrR family transcriptional regulator, fatty acid metabolism regulator protein
MIDAIVEVGFPRASVAEVARRAGVSKGVVTYHFAAKDDLIEAVISDVLASMTEYIEPHMRAANPQWVLSKFIPSYFGTYVDYYRTHAREVLALSRIYNAFRDESGRPNPAFDARAVEVLRVTDGLARGQAEGVFGAFDPGVMAAVMKAALDDVLTQFAENQDLDLEAYSAELVAMFERATRPDPVAEPSSVRPPAR